MVELVLGPILRRCTPAVSTVWVQTDAACTVEILGATTRTFAVCGHHYALVDIPDLPVDEVVSYEVVLDGRSVWPLPGAPPSTIRIPSPDQPLRVAFSSCLANGPQEPPWTHLRRDDADGLGPDALRALSLRVQNDPHTRPDALLLLGDQVYADQAAPELRDWIKSRRSVDEPPGAGVADFEEYAELFRRTWGEPGARWLLSTVPTGMIFDDHEIIDDWNISHSWVSDIREEPWWEKRVTSGLAAYWVYEQLGNQVPSDRDNELISRLRDDQDDSSPVFAAARKWDEGTTGTVGARWSYRWDVGGSTFLIIDSRNGRVLQDDRRSMLDDEEFAWLEEQMAGASGHVFICSSVPWLLAPGLHDFEGWNEALVDGAWGSMVARASEKLRRAADLEHWAAFRSSWQRLADMIEQAVRSDHADAPLSVTILSGDVHYSYAAPLQFAAGRHRPVWQLVSSPLRFPTERSLERSFDFATSRVAAKVGGILARMARLPERSATWSTTLGPLQHNGVAELFVDGPRLRVTFFSAHGEQNPILKAAGNLDLA